jgi:D-beta-D-heptose 7-phosphate kinase/D-beta-D-heptose 1-phosphate adenosyltransferase
MKIVFTNGCFDVLHIGHIRILRECAARGDYLIIGLNSDKSVKQLKGNSRPINNENDRKEMLEALSFVDEVIIFNETTPENLIKQINPNVLIKGGDWPEEKIVCCDFVRSYGGEVYSLPLHGTYSTTNIIQKIKTGP